jgi:hypothetical protein
MNMQYRYYSLFNKADVQNLTWVGDGIPQFDRVWLKR